MQTSVFNCKALELLENYPPKFQEYKKMLGKRVDSNQELSDRLIWYELDVGDLSARLTSLLLDANCGECLLVGTCMGEFNIELTECIYENLGKLVRYFDNIFTLTRVIVIFLKSGKYPLKEMGLLVFKLNIMENALSRMNFE
jgi:hypothetical protein